MEVLKMDTVSKKLNDLTFTDYYYRLNLIARSVFKWNGLPNCINEKWIERYLFYEGCCLFFEDKTRGFMVCKTTPSGRLNYYDEPTKLTPYGTDYMGKPLDNDKDCVLIQNNDLLLPTHPTIQLYAYRLADISRTIDINISAQKTPYIMTTNDKTKLSSKVLFKQIAGNEIVVYADKALDLDSIKILKTDAPVVFPELQVQKHSIWNECMTFLGVNNANMDKRERLVANEVQANNEQIQISADVMLKARQRACDMINELFGLNVSVELRNDLQTEIPNDSDVDSEGDE